MDIVYKVEKINMSGRVGTPRGRENAPIGYIYECQSKEDFDHKMQFESHHWKDVTEYPPAPAPVEKPKPVQKSKKGGK